MVIDLKKKNCTCNFWKKKVAKPVKMNTYFCNETVKEMFIPTKLYQRDQRRRKQQKGQGRTGLKAARLK